MSANLLVDLDAYYGGTTPSKAGVDAEELHHGKSSAWNGQAKQIKPTVEENNEDEEFGEFEKPAPSVAAPAPRVPQPKPYDPWADMQWSTAPQADPQARAGVVRGASSAIMRGTVDETSVLDQAYPTWTAQRPSQRRQRPPRDDNVLFDADDDEEEEEEGDEHNYSGDNDDFGAFETISKANPAKEVFDSPAQKIVLSPIEARPAIWEPPKKKAAPNLLDFDDEFIQDSSNLTSSPPQSRLHISEIDDVSGWGSFDDVQAPQITPKSPSHQQADSRIAANPLDEEAEAWGQFDDAPVQTTMTTKPTDNYDPPPLDLPILLPDIATSSAVPPTNIPPPSVLFTLFPAIIGIAQSRLFEPLAHLATDTLQRIAITTHPATKRFINDYLSIATTCAHIIGGRKNRWKRDAILAQSMRIGPASASGKSGGMKLTGLDKGENAKEEREAAEVVALWRRQAGKLRTAVAGVEGLSNLPELSDTMPVRMATQAEGAMTSPKACVLCGLKRNERINKVDVNIQDSFGEWWVEHWGHYTCMAFWEGHKDQLAGR